MNWLFNIEDTVDWLKSFGIWAVFISLLLSLIISILGVVPSLFLSAANAVVFGLFPGFLLSLLGETLGAAISFWLYRFGFSKLEGLKLNRWRWLQTFNDSGRKKQAIILLLARLTPLIPSGVITAAASISKMKFLDFILVTFIGKAPSIVLETFIGHDLIRANGNLPRLLISLLLVVILLSLFHKKNSR